MGTFAMWLEAKNNGLNENNIDDHKLVAMLNENFRLHRALIKRIVETGGDEQTPSPQEAEAIVKKRNPTLWQKLKGYALGPEAFLAALVALTGGLTYNAIHSTMNRPVGPHWDYGRNKPTNVQKAAEKSGGYKPAPFSAAESEKLRKKRFGGLPPDEDWEDLERRKTGGPLGYGFGYDNSGADTIPR